MKPVRLDEPQTLSSRSGFQLAVWTGGLLCGTAAICVAIAAATASHGTSFDWGTGAVAATAFATAVLAAFTGTLALGTVRDQQRSGRALVAVRLALPRQEHKGGTITYDITLRNVGPAPANYITLRVQTEDGARIPLVGTSTNDHFLRPGEETVVPIPLTVVEHVPEQLPDDIVTRVRGVFLDLNSRPEYFVWQQYRSGGMSFLFKTKPWPLYNEGRGPRVPVERSGWLWVDDPPALVNFIGEDMLTAFNADTYELQSRGEDASQARTTTITRDAAGWHCSAHPESRVEAPCREIQFVLEATDGGTRIKEDFLETSADGFLGMGGEDEAPDHHNTADETCPEPPETDEREA